MYNNEFIPNPYQLLFERLYAMERKIDKLISEKEQVKSEIPNDELMTVEDVADYLKISFSAVYQLTSRKEIPFMKKGKRLYFKKNELCQWVEQESNKPSSQMEKQELALSHLRPRKRKLR